MEKHGAFLGRMFDMKSKTSRKDIFKKKIWPKVDTVGP
jgi:hypothetical protein